MHWGDTFNSGLEKSTKDAIVVGCEKGNIIADFIRDLDL
jgi:hypothetical protein